MSASPYISSGWHQWAPTEGPWMDATLTPELGFTVCAVSMLASCMHVGFPPPPPRVLCFALLAGAGEVDSTVGVSRLI